MSKSWDKIDPRNDPKRKAKSTDPGWKYGYWPDLSNKCMVECILCGKRCNGGIKRLKEHLAGGFKNTSKCPKTTTGIAQEMALHMKKNRKNKLLIHDFDDEHENEGDHQPDQQSSNAQSSRFSTSTLGKRKTIDKSQVRGPLDRFVRRASEQVVDERQSKNPNPNQTAIENRFRTSEEKERVDMHIAEWWYECGIPFNAAKMKSFEVMCESIGQYGPGLKPPSHHELRVLLLDKSKKEADKTKQEYDEGSPSWS